MARKTDRRSFLKGAAAAAGVSMVGLALGVPGSAASSPPRLLPPAALPWREFLATCTGCGACVEACPPRALHLAKAAQGPEKGMPGFIARDTPCAMCQDTPCVTACAVGALGVRLGSVAEARMGVAALVGGSACLNGSGVRCDVCLDACPLPGQALTLESLSRLPTVHADACTGCGRCEKACVLEEPAIRVRPLTA